VYWIFLPPKGLGNAKVHHITRSLKPQRTEVGATGVFLRQLQGYGLGLEGLTVVVRPRQTDRQTELERAELLVVPVMVTSMTRSSAAVDWNTSSSVCVQPARRRRAARQSSALIRSRPSR